MLSILLDCLLCTAAPEKKLRNVLDALHVYYLLQNCALIITSYHSRVCMSTRVMCIAYVFVGGLHSVAIFMLPLCIGGRGGGRAGILFAFCVFMQQL